MDQRIIILSVLFGLFIMAQPLKAQIPNVYNDKKFSIATGIGVQYCFVGIQAKYFFSDFIGATLSSSRSAAGLLWQVGGELRIPELLPKRVSPYFNVSFGTNSSLRLRNSVFLASGNFFRNEEDKNFLGLTLGAGIKWDIFNNNKNYFKLGFDYRFANRNYNDTADRFNSVNLTNYSTDYNKFIPSIAYVFHFRKRR